MFRSSPFSIPVTLRQINKIANKLRAVLRDDDNDDDDDDEVLYPSFFNDLDYFIKGSLSLATELIQTKKDLGRTKIAEEIIKRRKAFKNTLL